MFENCSTGDILERAQVVSTRMVHIEIVERKPHGVEQLGRLHLISFY